MLVEQRKGQVTPSANLTYETRDLPPSPFSSPIKGEDMRFTPSPLAGEGWGEGGSDCRVTPLANPTYLTANEGKNKDTGSSIENVEDDRK